MPGNLFYKITKGPKALALGLPAFPRIPFSRPTFNFMVTEREQVPSFREIFLCEDFGKKGVHVYKQPEILEKTLQHTKDKLKRSNLKKTIFKRSLRTSCSLQDRLMGLNSDPNTDNEVKSAILLHCVHTTLSYLHTAINHFNILQQYLISTFEKENGKER